jgi:hypothetical protein
VQLCELEELEEAPLCIPIEKWEDPPLHEDSERIVHLKPVNTRITGGLLDLLVAKSLAAHLLAKVRLACSLDRLLLAVDLVPSKLFAAQAVSHQHLTAAAILQRSSIKTPLPRHIFLGGTWWW